MLWINKVFRFIMFIKTGLMNQCNIFEWRFDIDRWRHSNVTVLLSSFLAQLFCNIFNLSYVGPEIFVLSCLIKMDLIKNETCLLPLLRLIALTAFVLNKEIFFTYLNYTYSTTKVNWKPIFTTKTSHFYGRF